jgi:hypothetical protein
VPHIHCGCGKAFLGIGVRQQPERFAALDDGQDVEAPAGCGEISHGGMAGFVSGNDTAFDFGIGNGLGEAELFGHARLLDIRPAHGYPSSPDGPDQCFVQEVLEHDGRITERRTGNGVALGRVVQLGLVGLAGQVVIEDLSAASAARDVHPDALVEPPRAQ